MEDRFGHRISYLRVSITDRCNERCTYCMPHELQEWLAREDVLSYEETLRLIRIAAELGVAKVRITGGEPLTRRDVLGFFQQLPAIKGIDDIGISAMELCLRAGFAETDGAGVARAGVKSVNISLDTSIARRTQTTGRDFLPQVLRN